MIKEYIGENYSEIKVNILSGLTVALAMVPEAIAFALIAHLSPLNGLYAAIILSLVTSFIGGRPGMISGAAGAVAVVMVALVLQHGANYLFASIILMGVFQLIFGFAKLGKFIRMVPHSVMLGFVNGLAIVIFLAQFSHFKTLSSTGESVWISGKPLYIMLGLIAITILIIYLLPKLTKLVPSTLVAIVVVSLAAAYFNIDTVTVGSLGSIGGELPDFQIPSVPLNFETLQIILPYSLILAAVGLIESLLTLNLIDEMTETRGQPNKESIAQGISNFICGFFGGMGGCAMIGQSMININNGALKRLSGIATGVFLLSFILFFSSLIEMIPLAALIGVMFVVAEKTFEWGSLRLFGKVPKRDTFVVIIVAVITVVANLAIAVIMGVIISALAFAWQHAKHMSATKKMNKDGWKVYHLKGSLFFASISGFHEIFDPQGDPKDVIIDFEQSKVMDHSALVAIDTLAERYQGFNKKLHLRHLSQDCYELLDKAKGMIEVNLLEDPKYHIADDKIS